MFNLKIAREIAQLVRILRWNFTRCILLIVGRLKLGDYDNIGGRYRATRYITGISLHVAMSYRAEQISWLSMSTQ